MTFKFILIYVLFSFGIINAQVFLNGSFENNSAGKKDLINLSNNDCNLQLPYVNSFGTYGDVDIICSSTYAGGGAQDGNYYLGLTGGGSDIIALTLSSNLTKGSYYTISFYDRGTSYGATPIQIGLSASNNEVGAIIHTTQNLAINNSWTKRNFSFIAPNNGKYITVQMQSGGVYDTWINVDNFVLENSKCKSDIKIFASATTVKQDSALILTALGATDYTWSPSETLSAEFGAKVFARPMVSTIYTVSGTSKECGILTSTVQIKVIQPSQYYNDSITFINKKDTVVASIDSIRETKTIINKVNTLIKTKDPKKLVHSKRINGRKFVIQESLIVSGNSIKILVWDKNRVDGDQVSIYLNGVLLSENLTVTKTKKEITLNLEPGKNILVMHAINLGLVPPNTAALSINDGIKQSKIITLVSDLKKSGAIEIIYDPLVYNH